MTPVGGRRDRLIYLNFQEMLETALTALGWFSTANTLATKSVEFLAHQIDVRKEVQPNKIVVSAEDTETFGMEMGSDLEENRWGYFIEIFAEDDAVGSHLAGDIRDILKGKMPSIDRGHSWYSVYDLEQATPTRLFDCEIEEVDSQKSKSRNTAIRQHWYTVACIVVDAYENENDA